MAKVALVTQVAGYVEMGDKCEAYSGQRVELAKAVRNRLSGSEGLVDKCNFKGESNDKSGDFQQKAIHRHRMNGFGKLSRNGTENSFNPVAGGFA